MPKAIVDSRGCITNDVAVRQRVRVEMRSDDGFTVWGAGEPGEAEADAFGPVVSTESVPCVELLERVGWATVVAAAGASVEPVPTSVGTAKTEAKSLSAAGKACPRLGQRFAVVTETETRVSKHPEGAERSSILIRVMRAKIAKIGGGEREPTEDSIFGAGY